MAKKALVFLADGFEEVEAVTPIDYLRRAGIEVCTAGLAGVLVKGSHGVPVTADTELGELARRGQLSPEAWDAVLLPGGVPGAPNLAAEARVGAFLTAMAAAEKLVCAVCASPAVVLAPLGLLQGRRFTCFPGLEEKVSAGTWSDDRVVIDGTIITSRSAGTAAEWAVAVIAALLGPAESQRVAAQVLLKP